MIPKQILVLSWAPCEDIRQCEKPLFCSITNSTLSFSSDFNFFANLHTSYHQNKSNKKKSKDTQFYEDKKKELNLKFK